MSSYTLQMLWYDRQRTFAGVIAVTFSAALVALQNGLLIGMFSLASLPIDRSEADIWIACPDVVSVDVGGPIPDYFLTRLARQPEISRVEIQVTGYSQIYKSNGGMENCIVVGSRLDANSLGAIHDLTAEMRYALTEPLTVVVDRSELRLVGIRGVGDYVEIGNKRLRVVGVVDGVPSLTAPYVFCSIPTARALLRYSNEQGSYILGECRDEDCRTEVIERLQSYENMTVMSKKDFSKKSQMYWLTQTKGGIGLGLAAALGLLVGCVVTSQTLSATVQAAIRQYAILRALGIPRWRLVSVVLVQSFWVGVFGNALALPIVLSLAQVAAIFSVPVQLSPSLLATTGIITLMMAIGSGIFSLRALRAAEPATLLR